MSGHRRGRFGLADELQLERRGLVALVERDGTFVFERRPDAHRRRPGSRGRPRSRAPPGPRARARRAPRRTRLSWRRAPRGCCAAPAVPESRPTSARNVSMASAVFPASVCATPFMNRACGSRGCCATSGSSFGDRFGVLLAIEQGLGLAQQSGIGCALGFVHAARVGRCRYRRRRCRRRVAAEGVGVSARCSAQPAAAASAKAKQQGSDGTSAGGADAGGGPRF